MRLVKLTTLIALCTRVEPACVCGLYHLFPARRRQVHGHTTNYGGGDGSGGFITSLGPFNFSNPQSENNVPNSWATWNCPPATESCTPNILWNEGFNTLTMTFSLRLRSLDLSWNRTISR